MSDDHRAGIPERARLDRRTLTVWIEEEWLIPSGAADELAFTDMDLARANLIRDLKDNMGVNNEGLGVILHLLDQMHSLRRVLAATLVSARDSTAFIGLITSLWSSRAARGCSDLWAHLPVEVLGVENMVVEVGDPLAP